MRWDYSRPAGKLFLLDGKYAWFYTKGDPQVQRIEAKKLDDLRSPLRFLLGHTQLEKEIDHLAQSPGSNGTFTLSGIPHNQEKRIQRLTLTVTNDGTNHGHRDTGNRRRHHPLHLRRRTTKRPHPAVILPLYPACRRPRN